MKIKEKYFSNRSGAELCKGILNIICLLPILFYGLDAMALDLDAGVAAATMPLIKAVDDHWGKALILVSCGGAVMGGGKKN
jgi:hypothetical protein